MRSFIFLKLFKNLIADFLYIYIFINIYFEKIEKIEIFKTQSYQGLESFYNNIKLYLRQH